MCKSSEGVSVLIRIVRGDSVCECSKCVNEVIGEM